MSNRSYRGPGTKSSYRRREIEHMANSGGPSPHAQQSPHRSIPQQQLSLGRAGGPGPGAGTSRVGHWAPKHPGKKALLLALGTAAVAGGGGLVYDNKRRKAGVTKIDLGRARALQQSFQNKGNEKLARRAFQVHQRGARGPEGNRELMAARSRGDVESRENLPRAMKRRGMDHGTLADDNVRRLREYRRQKGVSKMQLIDPFSKAVPASPGSGTAVRSVKPIVPGGPHVTHENALSVTTHRNPKRGSHSALAMYRSGSKHKMTGGGRAYGKQTGHFKKSLDTQQGAARLGTRGTPLSGIAQSGRVGHRLRVV